jgi:hypothetical protein
VEKKKAILRKLTTGRRVKEGDEEKKVEAIR